MNATRTRDAPVPDVTSVDTAISPQDYYREMVERPDVRRVLTRLAQIEDGRAQRLWPTTRQRHLLNRCNDGNKRAGFLVAAY